MAHGLPEAGLSAGPGITGIFAEVGTTSAIGLEVMTTEVTLSVNIVALD